MIEYQIIHSKRKTLAIQITAEGAVIVRAPMRCPKHEIERLIQEKQDWILKHQKEARENTPLNPPMELNPRLRQALMNQAKFVIGKRTAMYASQMGIAYGRITIREQKSRWGSCSSRGNLNFNWRLILAPQPVLDYVIIHELAHRREMNHSPAFYKIVEAIMPDYKIHQQWLKTNGRHLWSTDAINTYIENIKKESIHE